MGDALFVHGGVTSALEARLALAGLLAVQGPGGLDVRTGVLAGPGSTTLITGTSATAPMQVAIAVHDGVLSRGTANGPYVMPTEAVQLVNIGAAPASGTRIDVVYEKQGDATPGVPTPDGATAPVYGVKQGTAGAGKPDLSTIVGAEELATVAVSAGATATNGANVLITNTARQTVARGGITPVRATETDAGVYVDQYRGHPDRGLERWDGTRWATPTPLGVWQEEKSTTGYSFGLGGTPQGVPFPAGGTSKTHTVPAGRQLECEFIVPRLTVPSAGTVQFNLQDSAAVYDGGEVSTPSTLWVPLRLRGVIVGDDAAHTIEARMWQGGGTGAGISGSPSTGAVVRYRWRLI